MSRKVLTELSKTLSYHLRHDPTLQRDAEGYIALANLPIHAPIELVQQIVRDSDKQRFALQERADGWFIRANQGHSAAVASQLEDDAMLTRLTDPIEGVFHGTYRQHLPAIQRDGLKRMSRKHIHLAKSHMAISGQRATCDVFLYIDMARAMTDGIIFYESTNGVILTEGIDGVLPPTYFHE
jgi:2'-phosphotransferase